MILRLLWSFLKGLRMGASLARGGLMPAGGRPQPHQTTELLPRVFHLGGGVIQVDLEELRPGGWAVPGNQTEH